MDSLLHGTLLLTLAHKQKPPLREARHNHGKNINEAQKALFFAKSPRADDLLLGVLCGARRQSGEEIGDNRDARVQALPVGELGFGEEHELIKKSQVFLLGTDVPEADIAFAPQFAKKG